MAGSKTRFGFSGNGEEPPNSGESGAARTVIGHDIHLPKLPPGFARPSAQAAPTPLPRAPVLKTPLPRAAFPASMSATITEPVAVRRPYRPQKSRLGRFLGRWTTGGHFRPRSRMGDNTVLDDAGAHENDLQLPRDTTGRHVLLVLSIALLTFSIAFAIVRIRQWYATPATASDAQAAKPQAGQPPLPPVLAPSVALPPPPAPPAAPPPTEKPMLLGTPPPSATAPSAIPPRPRSQTTPTSPARVAPARNPATVPASSGSSHPRKRLQPETTAVEPPDHLKGELLPLSP
jgi:hypothetical protein